VVTEVNFSRAPSTKQHSRHRARRAAKPGPRRCRAPPSLLLVVGGLGAPFGDLDIQLLTLITPDLLYRGLWELMPILW
jgi:hypothetical protein